MKKHLLSLGLCLFLLLFGFSSAGFSLDLSLFGPLRYTQTTADPTVQTAKFMGDPMKAPRWLIIRNGEEGGTPPGCCRFQPKIDNPYRLSWLRRW